MRAAGSGDEVAAIRRHYRAPMASAPPEPAGTAPHGTTSAGAVPAGVARAANVWLAALVGWTLFVWVGRIRNVNADPEAAGADYWGPMVLSLSFVVLVAAVGITWWLRRRTGATADRGAAGRYRAALWSLAGWTTAVWVVRAGDIALTSDRGAAFIAVHVVLAVVSIGLSIAAVRADRKVRTFEHTPPVTASQ